ncbi:MAG: hypothetical protein V3T70_00450, partial [Phycisphaerae bacterium]
MTPARRSRSWALATLTVAAPLTALAVTVLMRGRVTFAFASVDGIRAESQSHVDCVRTLAARGFDAEALLRTHAWLRQREADALKPALVVADLTAACRAVGAAVESIRPIAGTDAAGRRRIRSGASETE